MPATLVTEVNELERRKTLLTDLVVRSAGEAETALGRAYRGAATVGVACTDVDTELSLPLGGADGFETVLDLIEAGSESLLAHLVRPEGGARDPGARASQ